MRITYWKQNQDSEPIIAKISTAKRLLKEKGGHAWTEHYERDGTLFETTDIKLKGNNSRFRYNRYL